jgi:hypothetical protein
MMERASSGRERSRECSFVKVDSALCPFHSGAEQKWDAAEAREALTRAGSDEKTAEEGKRQQTAVKTR